MSARTLLVIAMALAVSGCLTSTRGHQGPLPSATLPSSGTPPGCDRARPATAAVAGKNASFPAGTATPIPCLSYIGTATFEPTIGLTKDGSVFMYPAAALGIPATVQIARSQDEGKTWKILTPNAAGQPTHPYSQDPFMFVDPGTGRLFAEDLLLLPPTCGMMSISDDEGGTWMTTQSGCATTDHVSIFSGPAPEGVTRGYPNIVYRCSISGGAVAGASSMVACQRSIDGGLTWLPPGQPAFTFVPGTAPGGCDGGNGHGATDAQGVVYLPRGNCGQPWLAISTDEAQTWRTTQVSQKGMACGGGTCEHDAGVGVDPGGTLYYSWIAADRQPYLARSHDSGRTWTSPVPIGFPGLKEASHLQMIVGGTGRLAIVYYGSTNSPGAPWTDSYEETTWNAYMTLTTDADNDTPLMLTASVNEPSDPLIRGECPPLRCQEVFDFIDVRVGPDGTPWAALVDGCFDACTAGTTKTDNGPRGFVGRLWGGPSLWDADVPHGPFSTGGTTP